MKKTKSPKSRNKVKKSRKDYLQASINGKIITAKDGVILIK